MLAAAHQNPSFVNSSIAQDNQSVLSPFAAYSRIQQAMAANSASPDLYNPFHQFPYFSLTNAAQQFAAAARGNSAGSQKAASLLMNSSGGGSPSSSENNSSRDG